MDNFKNTGFLDKVPSPSGWRLGGVTGFELQPLVDDGDWTQYLPVEERQRNATMDTMSCVTFSMLNCIEVLYKRKYGVEVNYSDRFIAKASNTSRRGNWLETVAKTARNVGLIPEKMYPFGKSPTWEIYHKELDNSFYEEGKRFLTEYKIEYQFVDIRDRDVMMQALHFTPLQVSGRYPSVGNAVDGIIPYNNDPHDHAFTIYNAVQGEYMEIFDHYTNVYKKIAWDYSLGVYAYQYDIIKLSEVPMEKPEIENNTLVQLVESPGGFGFFLDGNIILDDLSAILATNEMRNKEQRTISLKKDQWDLFDKVNLKGEPLNT